MIKTCTVLLAKLKNKAGGLSVKQEELDIKSTGARNDYILSLTTANAHRERYHKSDLPVSVPYYSTKILSQNGLNSCASTLVGFLVKALGVDFTLCGFDEKTITFLLPTHIKKIL